MRQKGLLLIAAILTISFFGLTLHAVYSDGGKSDKDKGKQPNTPQEQAAQFIEYFNSITLTPEQEEMKYAALSTIPAPCCSDYSIATCCCPCNLAKAVWGYSHFLIAKQGYQVTQVREAVQDWIRQTNEDEFSGQACYNGRCNQPMDEDGCGGMDERLIS